MAYLVSNYSYNSHNYERSYSSYYHSSNLRRVSRSGKFFCPPKPCKEINIIHTPKAPFRRWDYVPVGDKLVKIKRLKVDCKASSSSPVLTSDSTDALSASIKESKKNEDQKGVWKWRKNKETCFIREVSLAEAISGKSTTLTSKKVEKVSTSS